MSAVVLAAAVWPVVLLAIGLLIGRLLRRGDRLGERRPTAVTPTVGRPHRSAPRDGRAMPATFSWAGTS